MKQGTGTHRYLVWGTLGGILAQGLAEPYPDWSVAVFPLVHGLEHVDYAGFALVDCGVRFQVGTLVKVLIGLY